MSLTQNWMEQIGGIAGVENITKISEQRYRILKTDGTSNLVDLADLMAGLSGTGGDLKALNPVPSTIMGFAGRNLQTLWELATPQLAFAYLRAIKLSGDFSGLRLGDYIDLPELVIGADSVKPAIYPARTLTWNATYENLRCEIVGFDDYYGVGHPTEVTAHHITMMFKNIPTTAPFNETNVNTGGYKGSMLTHWLTEQFLPALVTGIGIEPYSVGRYIAGTSAWDSDMTEKIFIPTPMNIYGTPAFASANYGVGTQSQFAKFALKPNSKIKKFNGSRSSWWLGEHYSSTSFCSAYDIGHATRYYASHVLGVVLAFLI